MDLFSSSCYLNLSVIIMCQSVLYADWTLLKQDILSAQIADLHRTGPVLVLEVF